jgi:hypothetical protein
LRVDQQGISVLGWFEDLSAEGNARSETMSDPENLQLKIQSSRRNLIQIGSLAAAIFASRMSPAKAAGGNQCFLRGTMILTVTGGRRVEDLAVGDLLPTLFRGPRPIRWIGRYPYRNSDPSRPWVRDALPVRVARSALAPDVPHADLYVTKSHALFIDGVLVPAGCLINGTTITLYEARELDELEYFHIKLEHHDVIHAEGAPCETLQNVDENAVNFAEYFREYGALETEEAPCAPLLSFNGGRSEIKSRFRSAMSPWLDRRQKLDVIRDRLEERGIALLRQPELVS